MHVERNRSSLPSLIGHLDTINFPKAPARFPERAGAEFLAGRAVRGMAMHRVAL